jgi:GNAT superfamily N-acetyltransferase
MKIRRYYSNDFDRMMNLHREVLIKENVYRGTGVWEDDLLDIEEHYFKNNGEFIIGIENEEIIAMGAIRKINEETAEIVRMRVHPEYQGKGIGRQILNELELFASEHAYKKLVLETDERLSSAIRLYQKNGYIFWKEEMLNGFKCIWYKKEIFR